MKKILILILVLGSVLLSLAAENPDDVTNQVGLELEDTDNVVFEVYSADVSAGLGEKVTEISFSRDNSQTNWDKYVYFRIKVTSTHTIYLTLSTDGPLKLDGNRESDQSVDYSLFYSGLTYFESNPGVAVSEDSSINFKIELPATVFGKFASSTGEYDYSAKNFMHIGNDGYLNINDATLSYFSVRIEKKNTEGKQFGTYSSNIYVTATTAD